MNAIRRNLRGVRSQAGQGIYQTMLIIACVALALAVFFPVYEFFDYYSGGDVSSTTTRPPQARPREEPAVAEPGETPAPAETTEAPGEPEETVEPAEENGGEPEPAAEYE